MPGFARKCPCLRPKIEDEIKVLDYKHASLHDVPTEVFNKERTLEELYLDCNQIRDLPRELFFCHGLRKLYISDNEIVDIPPAISSLANLEELDFSKNGIIEVPDHIKGCKYLRSIDASVNPLGRLPEGFTFLSNLTRLYLNDTFLDYLPGSIGRMVKLKILELRENHIKSLPRSFSRLVDLERLDIGNNEFTELSDVIGGLRNLLELWCDNNQITTITRSIGNLKHLMYLDASKNELQELPKEIDGCVSLADLYLSANDLVELPDSIGSLKNLITLKVDDNQLAFLPRTLGGLSLLSELNVSVNNLEELPASIGLLRNLRTLYADENLLKFIPAEIGSCSGITVLSLRNNKLTYIPDELGRIPRLRVLNLSDNLLRYLPFSVIKLKELQALWLTENQTRPLIPLQSEYEPDTGRKILTCYLLPQGELVGKDETDHARDSNSFNASVYDEDRQRRQQIHFDFAEGSDEESTLVRCPTPYPKELKQKVRHARSLALRQLINEDSGSGIYEDAVSDAVDTDQEARKARITKQKEYGHSQGSDKAEVRMREGRGMRPASPRLQESHRLYRYDKEKLMKDKARMQHRLSVPEFDSGLNGLLKNVHNQNRKVKQEEALSSCRSDSVPNLTSDGSRDITFVAKDPRMSAQSSSLTFNDIYYKQPVSQHKRRRPRRLRDYNSDTDYRSDIELKQFRHEVKDDSSQGANSEILSVQSQPLPHLYYDHYKNNGRWRETTGCASDIEAYSRGSGSFPTANAAAAAYQRKYQQLNHSSLQNISLAEAHLRAGTPDSFKNIRPNTVIKSESNKFDKRTSNDFHLSDRKNDLRRNTTSQCEYPQRTARTKYCDSPENTHIIVTNDELYKHTPRSEYNPTSQCKIKSNPAINNHYSSSQTSLGPVHEQTSNTLKFQPELTSGPTMQFSSNSELLQQKPASSTQNDISQNYSASLPSKSRDSTLNGSNSSLHRSSHSPSSSPPVFHKDIIIHSTPIQHKTKPMTSESPASLSFAAANEYKGSKLSIVFEERALSEKHLATEESDVYGKLLATPPPYNPAPPYVKPSDTAGLGRCTNRRLSSDLAFGHADSPRSTPYLAANSTIDNFIVNQPNSSPCGFHGSDPYTDLPTAAREKLSFRDYEDSDHKRQNNSFTSDSYRSHRGTPTQNSDSSSSHLGSVSTTGTVYPSGRDAVGRCRSNSFDSQIDVHNNSSSAESPHSGSVYCSSRPRSRQQCPPDPYSLSIDAGNYEELLTATNQEQSSQVSSSSDSGYSHGHHVYELIGDHFNAQGEKLSLTQGDHIPGKLKTISASSPQRLSLKGPVSGISRAATPVKGLSRADSTTQEHKEQFRITIKKNPGLGFSIAGGIGSHGNPFREEDIGIFVTKVVPNGAAAKFLQPGDKILEVNKVDFEVIEHNQAVAVLKKNSTVTLLVERIQKVNVV